MKRFVLNGLFVSLLYPCLALGKANNDPGGWYGFFNKTSLAENYSWWTETQLRYNLDSEQMGQTLVRTGLLVAVDNSDSKSEFGILYAFIHTGLTKEHRLALQHTMNYLGFLQNFSHRMRYEIRTLEVGGAPSHRFRYLLRHQGPTIFSRSKVIFWDEVFLNTKADPNDEIDHLDRNRLFVGLRVPFDNLALEVGYLNQWAPRSTEAHIDHIATLYMFF